MAFPANLGRYQKLCTLRIHDASFSQEEVLFNLDNFSEFSTWTGNLAQIVPLKHGVTTRDFAKPKKADDEPEDSSQLVVDRDGTIIGAVGPTELATEIWRAYTFVINDAPKDIKEKDLKLRVSDSLIIMTSSISLLTSV